MKLKNASFFQLHIEKIVLAGGVLFLLVAVAVVVFGVILKPYQVELSGRTYDEPADVIPQLVKNAQGLTDGLRKTNREIPEGVPEGYHTPDLSTNYTQMMAQPLVQTSAPLALADLGGLSAKVITPIDPVAPSYYLPTPPMVDETRFKNGFEVLDTTQRDYRNAYEAVWNESRVPADFSYVYIEGEFDMNAWIETLQARETHENMVPPGIWMRKLGLATVYLIREERDPITGQWGNAMAVPTLPGYFGIAPLQEVSDAPDQVARWIEQLLFYQLNIAMVDPPLLADGEELLSPLDDPMTMFDPEALAAMEAEERAEELAERRRLQEEERARRRAEREAERGRDNSGPEGLGPGGPGGGGRGGRGGRGGGGASPGGQSPEAPGRGGGRDSQRPDRSRDNERPTGPRNPGGPDSLGPGLQPEEHTLAEGKRRVWAIDVTAVPGTTYRYKLIVGVINPLYGVDRLEESQRSENRNRAALLPSGEDIAKAPWIGPIEIEPSTRFFVTSANNRGARVNVWHIHNGERLNHLFEVSPGDTIGGMVEQVDMQVGAVVVDIDRRQDITGKTIWVLIYIDAQGNLHERLIDDDKSASSQFDREIRAQREAEERALEMMQDPQGPGGPGGPGSLGPGLEPGMLGPGGGRGPGRGGGRQR